MSMSITLTLDERLNQILPRLTSRDFLDSKGLGNEIGFWIFDYPPEREMDVRGFLTLLDPINFSVARVILPINFKKFSCFDVFDVFRIATSDFL